jgi:hypothetical protein
VDAGHLVDYYHSGHFTHKHTCGALFLKNELAEIKRSGTKCPACMGGQLDLKEQFERLQKGGRLRVSIIRS